MLSIDYICWISRGLNYSNPVAILSINRGTHQILMTTVRRFKAGQTSVKFYCSYVKFSKKFVCLLGTNRIKLQEITVHRGKISFTR